jgi:hypothetical protein
MLQFRFSPSPAPFLFLSPQSNPYSSAKSYTSPSPSRSIHSQPPPPFFLFRDIHTNVTSYNVVVDVSEKCTDGAAEVMIHEHPGSRRPYQYQSVRYSGTVYSWIAASARGFLSSGDAVGTGATGCACGERILRKFVGIVEVDLGVLRNMVLNVSAFETYAVLVGVNNVRLIDVDVCIVVPAVSVMIDVSVTSGRKNWEQNAVTSSVTFSGLLL